MNAPSLGLVVRAVRFPRGLVAAVATSLLSFLPPTMGLACGGLAQTQDRMSGDASPAETGGGMANDAGRHSCAVPCEAVPPSTAACVHGRCVVTLSNPDSQAVALAVDSERVYWTDRGLEAILTVPLGGGVTRTLASGSRANSYSLAIDTAAVYWTGGDVMRVGKSGGAPKALVGGDMEYGMGVAVRGGEVYWVDSYGGGFVKKVSSAGGTAIPLVQGKQPACLAVDDTSVYWTDVDGSLYKTSQDGATTLRLAKGPSDAYDVAVDATSVYWVSVTAGTVSKIPIAGGPVSTLARGSNQPTAIAVDDTSVYWASIDAVLKVPLDGGTVTTLSENGAAGVAVDGTSVYFSSNLGAVVRVTPK